MTDYNKAAECLRLALPIMAEKQVSATPVNYAVFYEYVSKTNELLNAELDKIMAANTTISSSICQEVYDKKLVAFELATLRKMQEGLRSIVDGILKTLQNADDETSNYVNVLDGMTKDLTQTVDPEKILSIVNLLSHETKQARHKHSHMKADIEGNQQEVIALRQELERVRLEATTDALTGLLNRKAIDTVLREEMQREDRQDEDLCMLMIDIDKFKRINDNYGHLIGDKVIRYVANIIKTNVNIGAKVSRFGGEEFMVVLPNTSITTAVNIAENIRKAQEKGKLIATNSKETIGRVTVSVGVAHFVVNELMESFIDRADKALYQAKTNGRNCVVRASQPIGKVATI